MLKESQGFDSTSILSQNSICRTLLLESETVRLLKDFLHCFDRICHDLRSIEAGSAGAAQFVNMVQLAQRERLGCLNCPPLLLRRPFLSPSTNSMVECQEYLLLCVTFRVSLPVSHQQRQRRARWPCAMKTLHSTERCHCQP